MTRSLFYFHKHENPNLQSVLRGDGCNNKDVESLLFKSIHLLSEHLNLAIFQVIHIDVEFMIRISAYHMRMFNK